MARSPRRVLAVLLLVLAGSLVTSPAHAAGTTPQTLQFTSPTPSGAIVGWRYGYAVTASSSSGLPVVISADPATPACTATSDVPFIYGNVAAVHAGTCRIFADQPGDDTYAPAPRITMTFEIGQEITVVTPKNVSKNLVGLTPSTFKAALSFEGWAGPGRGLMPYTGQQVVFRVGGKVVCTGTTVLVPDGSFFGGSAIATCKATLGLAAALRYSTYTASYAGSQDYSGSSATGRLV